jgi:hypothetical protein
MDFWLKLKRDFTQCSEVVRAYIETSVREIGRQFWIARSELPNDQEFRHVLRRFGINNSFLN